jgi:hypothetical protein
MNSDITTTTVTYEDVNPWIEALKEGARTVVIAVIPLLIDYLTRWEFDWRTIFVVAGIAILRVVDKYMHLQGKETDNSTLIKGLTQF